jgi:DNA-binding CsgD family transcriptional regulator
MTLAAVAFCPNFDLALAEALVPDVDVARALEALVALSLVRDAPSRTGETRFRVFESIRQEIARRTPAADRETYLARHAAAMLETSADLARAIDEQSPRWAFDRLEDDADNARQALDTLEDTDPTVGARLWTALRHLWHRPSRFSEGLARLARLEERGNLRDEDLCAALSEALWLVESASGFGSGLALLERALAIARRVDDVETQMSLLTERTRIHAHFGDGSAAESDAELVGAIAAAHPSDRARFLARDARVFAATLSPEINEATMATAKDAALSAIKGASIRTRHLREGNVAMFHVYGHEYAAALAQVDRVLARRLDQGPNGIYIMDGDLIWFFHVRSEALAGLGRLDEATAQIAEGVALCPPDPPLQDVIVLLSSAQLVAAGQGKHELAARLFGWLERDGRFDFHDRKAALSVMRVARRHLGETATELAIRDGEAADPVQFLRSLPQLLADGAASPARGLPRHGELTRREVEVVALVARGRSNREIADALFISPKTASVHVANIKEKLGAQTRLEVALRAREMGLANVARTAFD